MKPVKITIWEGISEITEIPKGIVVIEKIYLDEFTEPIEGEEIFTDDTGEYVIHETHHREEVTP